MRAAPSGTTGKPKGAILTERWFQIGVKNTSLVSAAEKNDVFLLWEPFYHLAGWFVILLSLRHGLTSAMVELRIRALVDQMQASVDRVASRGVELRDIDRGLIDFPATAFGRAFLLCWEEADGDVVAFAHAMGEGFNARLPIAAFLRRHAAGAGAGEGA